MQGAQTASRYRGVGRYALSLCRALIRLRGEHEVLLLLNGAFEETLGPLRETFAPMLPPGSIHVWFPPGPVAAHQPANAWRRHAAELSREAALASLAPDLIYVPNLFEGFVDDAAVSIGRLDTATPVCVTLHDLIPLLNPEQYLHDSVFEAFYRDKIAQLQHAALLLANSDSTRQEGLTHLALEPSRIVNVFGAVDGDFAPLRLTQAEGLAERTRLGIDRNFILYTGGADRRKNLPRLIQAYAALPAALRATHQLVFAGHFSDAEAQAFRGQAHAAGLRKGELVLTGYVSDQDLVLLYNLCEVFVFPSWHEGLGLPAMEAMRCGTAVIGANTSSLPEVIGCRQALFDPHSTQAMTDSLQRVLTDEAFRQSLCEHGLERAATFSWDDSARKAWQAFEGCAAWQTEGLADTAGTKPVLAYVSPLPPERSGISDYSVELLPALARYYRIELVVDQDSVDRKALAPLAEHGVQLRDVAWLRAHAHRLDRVLYQVGNSPLHRHMFALLRDIPGMVVLHDFFLSSAKSWLEVEAGEEGAWVQALYESHGYDAVRARFHEPFDQVKLRYPASFEVLQHARGVAVHSEYARQLAMDWYGAKAAASLHYVPLLRAPVAQAQQRAQARRELGWAADDFVVCSFGFLDATKLNHVLLRAWLDSALSTDPRCRLVFVGENHGGDYGRMLAETIAGCQAPERVQITGWTDLDGFRRHLGAADLAVQLRASSRGETSGAVLDCLNFGLPTIVNANGSFGELPADVVEMLPDDFDPQRLAQALEALWNHPARRQEMAVRAREYVAQRHHPDRCAKAYMQAMEACYRQGRFADPAAVLDSVLRHAEDGRAPLPDDADCQALAQALDASIGLRHRAPVLYVDVTGTADNDRRTGIERVTRALCLAWLDGAVPGLRVEPIRLSHEAGGWAYRHARAYTLALLECPPHALADDLVSFRAGDTLLVADLSGERFVQAGEQGLLRRLGDMGVQAWAIVHDILPVTLPQYFPPDADAGHVRWLEQVVKLDGAVCVSRTVAQELSSWVQAHAAARSDRFGIEWFHHGADLDQSAPTMGLPDIAPVVAQACAQRPTLLMVGTIEPRKGYAQALSACELLWSRGEDFNLVIVGREGWTDLPAAARRDIPQTVRRLRNHPQGGQRLFWLEGVSDEYLEQLYSMASGLLFASWGEGFGLPLIEAARRGLPLVLRDIPVFREIAGERAWYVSAGRGEDAAMAQSLSQWLAAFRAGEHPGSQGLTWQTWADSARQVARACLPRTQ
ncbi:glycosyltransferase [Orrella sp. JC864]|uniref:glycosyltransferase n=1 Tax=Orrella sp. JC864 TaxID=3120298 RepID=UPI00300B8910